MQVSVKSDPHKPERTTGSAKAQRSSRRRSAAPCPPPPDPPARPARSRWLSASLIAWCRAEELDHRLAAGMNPAASPALAIRARRVTSPRIRRRLAAGLAQALTSAETFTGADTAACREVLGARTVLMTLQRRLLSTEPISPEGAAMLLDLLTDGASPLYLYLRPGELGSRLRTAAAALQTGPPSSSDLAEPSVVAEPQGAR